MAIVSTPEKVAGFLNKVFKTDKESSLFYPVEHRKVKYKPEPVDHTNIRKRVPFIKQTIFEKENEYRFVLRYGWEPQIDSFIFFGGIDYMETCYTNPSMCKKQKQDLLLIVEEAICAYGDFHQKKIHDIFANADNILPPYNSAL